MKAQWNSIIDGKEVPPAGGSYFPAVNPSDGEVLAEVARGTDPDVDLAVEGAARAFREWRRTPPADRGRALTEVAQQLRARTDHFAELEALDTGKPLSLAAADIGVAARYFEFFAGAADKLNGETIPLGPDFVSYTVHEPYGVVGLVLPWNAPMQQAARGLAPALASGNTVTMKPAEDASLTCIELTELLLECGIPPGVLNVVPGYGSEAGEALVRHPGVAKIMFTGSVEVGRRIGRIGGENLVPAGLELGGKSPNLVFADADLDAAASSSVTAVVYNAGQACSAGSRLLLDRAIYDDFIDLLVERFGELVVGPALEDPDIGPITTREQYERVREYLQIGSECAARVAYSAALDVVERFPNGNYVAPTIYADVDNTMTIAREEIFGPVLSVIPFESEDEAVAIANDTDYGLVAGVHTQDIDRAHRVAQELEAGQVFINQWFAGGVETPFGGYKNSGIGREKGLEALRHYTQVKTITTRVRWHP